MRNTKEEEEKQNRMKMIEKSMENKNTRTGGGWEEQEQESHCSENGAELVRNTRKRRNRIGWKEMKSR